MINSSLKDKIAQDIAAVAGDKMRCLVDPIKKAQFFDISPNEYISILDYFKESGLIKMNKAKDAISIHVLIGLYDMINQGGYTAKDELLKSYFKKLELELKILDEQANPSLKTKIKEIVEIISTISSITFFK